MSASTSAETVRSAAPLPKSESEKKISVFIVDDHPVTCEGLKALLSTQPDMQVVGETRDGANAVKEIPRLQPNVVVADIVMPELTGIEMTRQVRDASPRTRVLILSMYSESHYVLSALESGAAGYLLKENAGDMIVEAVRSVHRGEFFICRQCAAIIAKQVVQGAPKGLQDDLSPREREVMRLVVEGKSSKEIASMLNLSVKTVETYRSRVLQKLDVDGTVALVKLAIRHGIVPP